MEMTEMQRRDFAERVERERIYKFGDNKKAAYTKAGVNSGTWDRLEAGLPVAPRTLSTVCRNLWPDSEGDWRRLVGVDPLRQHILEADIAESTRQAILDILDRAPPDPPAEDRAERGA
jgi:hypothetical protein